MSGDADGTVTAAFASHDIATDPDALVDILVSRRATVHDHRVPSLSTWVEALAS
jgi:hypothetical protein